MASADTHREKKYDEWKVVLESLNLPTRVKLMSQNSIILACVFFLSHISYFLAIMILILRIFLSQTFYFLTVMIFRYAHFLS